jgi:transposase-like protein
MNVFKHRFIIWAVQLYCRNGICYRELEEMLSECGVNVDQTTIYRWVQRYAPLIQEKLKWCWRLCLGGS